ncbi:MAG TPA: hypothetical protein VEU29_01110 [Actinomycetota bacterium]|nr:hypothetical protein [Actinomycetota bacterium]
MGGYADKVQKAVEDQLRPGEKVLGAIRTQPRGTVMGTGIGGLVGAAVAQKQAGKARAAAGEGSTAASWPAAKFALSVTDQRLAAFSFSAMGKPKDLKAETPLDQVVSIEQGNAKITKSVVVSFADGSGIELECGKLEKVDDFISAFNSAKASAP